MGERVRQRLLQLAGVLDAPPESTEPTADGGKVRIDELRPEVDDARGLHLQLDEVQRRIVEDHHLDRQPALQKRDELTGRADVQR